jgi:hypothetical protein
MSATTVPGGLYAEICYSSDEGRYYAEIIDRESGKTLTTTLPVKRVRTARADARAAIQHLSARRSALCPPRP